MAESKVLETNQTGVVKFYLENQSFGFIVRDKSDSEIFFHKTCLLEPVNKGDSVTFNVEEGKRGVKAVGVLKSI